MEMLSGTPLTIARLAHALGPVHVFRFFHALMIADSDYCNRLIDSAYQIRKFGFPLFV